MHKLTAKQQKEYDHILNFDCSIFGEFEKDISMAKMFYLYCVHAETVSPEFNDSVYFNVNSSFLGGGIGLECLSGGYLSKFERRVAVDYGMFYSHQRPSFGYLRSIYNSNEKFVPTDHYIKNPPQIFFNKQYKRVYTVDNVSYKGYTVINLNGAIIDKIPSHDTEALSKYQSLFNRPTPPWEKQPEPPKTQLSELVQEIYQLINS